MSQPQPIKVIHCLSFLYLAFAHQTDGDLSDDERSVIRGKLNEWCPEESLDSISEYMDDAIDWYNGLDHDGRINEIATIATNLKDNGFTGDNRKAVLNDLVSIAKSDGSYDETEKKWVVILADCMGMQYEA